MEGIVTIKPGKSLPFDFTRGGQTIVGWICTISLKIYPDDVSAITPRIITPTDGVWSGYLTQTETAALAVANWQIIAQLVNATDDEEECIIKRFNVGKGWV